VNLFAHSVGKWCAIYAGRISGARGGVILSRVMINKSDRTGLFLQGVIGRIAAFVTMPLGFLFVRLMGYRIRDLKRLRADVRRIFGEHQGPWLICPNHLTMIDSVVISYGLFSLFDHIFRFRDIPWNLPERKNFHKNFLLVIICYLMKCIPVDRGGSRERVQRLLDQCIQVLDWRQSLLVFPEGKRSRSGRVDRENFSYGVGRLIYEQKETRVLLIYFRGDGQQTYGSIPRFGEHFTMTIEAFTPKRGEGGGLRVQRAYAAEIVEKLAVMEERYFASRG
jgi:1-acyl-sn-glycerol-3-phosphate acyltransferase